MFLFLLSFSEMGLNLPLIIVFILFGGFNILVFVMNLLIAFILEGD